VLKKMDSDVPQFKTSNGPLPLYVDLDGTLIKTDILFEGAIKLIKLNPIYLLFIMFWCVGGPRHLKQQIFNQVDFNPAILPYRQSALEYIKLQKKIGRPIVLATAADHRAAKKVASHLGLFEAVLATDELNLKGNNKLEAIVNHAKGKDFEYIGDSLSDYPILMSASRATIVKGNKKLAAKLNKQGKMIRILPL
jgi:phosphoserine phosphatase